MPVTGCPQGTGGDGLATVSKCSLWQVKMSMAHLLGGRNNPVIVGFGLDGGSLFSRSKPGGGHFGQGGGERVAECHVYLLFKVAKTR